MRNISTSLLLAATAACGQGFTVADPTPEAGVAFRPVQLEVTNQSGGPIEIHAVGGGTSYRIGTVHPGLTGRFQVRRGMVANGAVEFLARYAGGRQVRSGPMLVRPGDVVDFALTPHTATSLASVRAWVEGRR